MLLRTHIAISLFGILVFFSLFQEKAIFVLAVIVATLFPDIDCETSKLGRKGIFRPFQFFIKHRGFFHSFTFLILLVILCFIFLENFRKEIIFGFLIGYGLHLIADSFTKKGVRFFYPLTKKKFRFLGGIRSGGKKEIVVFSFFIAIDIILIVLRFL
ncbi:MAG TPA: metal-dependent hydrolase [Candidatus Nanoarchaeia archaeon]|nr:metal-dependent hydrolase [Candidatus Nanoarchaeia archaeon]